MVKFHTVLRGNQAAAVVERPLDHGIGYIGALLRLHIDDERQRIAARSDSLEPDVECRDTFRHCFFLGVFPADSETVRHIWVHRYLSHFRRTDDAVRLDLLQVRVFEFLHTVLKNPREDAPRRDEFFRHSIIGRVAAIQIRVWRCFHHRFTSLSSSLFYHTLGRLRYEDAAILISSERIQDTWGKRITTDKAFPAWGRWRAERAG